jgi:hypothetical protein
MNILQDNEEKNQDLHNSKDFIYNIHNLIHVILSHEVSNLIVKDVNFQISSFLVDKIDFSEKIPKILIYPYKNKNNYIQDQCDSIFFYKEVGVLEKYIDNQEKKLFICKNNNLIICADYPNFLINSYIQLLLIEQNHTLIHASAFQSKSGKINIFTGAGGTGKTAVLGYAVSRIGLKYLGDDLVIVNSRKQCLSFPRNFVLKKYHRQIYSNIFREKKIFNFNLSFFKRLLHENLPFVGIIKVLLKKLGLYYKIADKIRPKDFLATVSPEKIFGINTFINKGIINSIVYLDKTLNNNFSIKSLTEEIASNRIMSVIHHEFRDYNSHLLSLGALNVINYNIYMKTTSQLLSEILKNLRLSQLLIPHKSSPDDLIDFLITKNFFD